MVETLGQFTPEQQFRFIQFYRAATIYNEAQKHELEIAQGIPVILRDNIQGDAILLDFTYLRMIRGALRGMLNECIDIGLRHEVGLLGKHERTTT